MNTFKVKNEAGEVWDVDEDKLGEAEKDGYLPVVTNGREEYRVSLSDLGKAEKDGFRPLNDKPTTTEAVLRGGVQGLSAGFADETAGTAQGMWDDAKALFQGRDANNGVKPEYDEFGRVTNGDKLTGNYKKYRDEYRAADKAAEEAHPLAYKGSEIAGAVAGSAFIPGSNTIKGAALLGGVQGAGMSEAEDLKGLAKDTTIGAGTGAAAAYITPKVIDAGKRAAGWAGKKIGNVLFGVGDEATEKYLQNPDTIRSAKPLKEVTDQFLNKVDDISHDTSIQSSDAYKTLGNHVQDIATVTDPLVESANKLRELGLIGKDRKSAVNFLEGITEDVANLADDSGKISLDKGKQVLSVLDAEYKRLVKQEADTQTIKTVGEARKNLDAVLKEISPDYKAQMTELAKDTEAVQGIASKFRTDGGAEKLLQRVSRGKDQYAKDALQNFDSRFGTEFGQDLENAAIKNQFTRETTNGSRRTMLGTVVGGAVGSVAGGPLGAGIGSAVGASAGATIDKVGGRIWQAVLDGTLKVGPYAKVLEDAAKRGPASVGITHMLLMKNYPDYRAAVEGSGHE